MSKFFAIARSDNSYIVNAETAEELNARIDEIREKYRDYYLKYIAPGYYVVQAENLREAKSAKKEVAYDLPLFKTPVMEYRIYSAGPENGELELQETTANLQSALEWFKARPGESGQIVVANSAGETVKVYSESMIRERIGQ